MNEQSSDVLDFARRLREARERTGLSQGQAARALQMHRPTISECEAGRRKVSATELKQFADLYRVTSAWLMGEVDLAEDPEVAIAARELARLRPIDRQKVLEFLHSVSQNSRNVS